MIQYIKVNFDYPVIGAEVGIGLGNHATEIVQNLQLRKLYLIDHWREYTENGLTIKTYAGKADYVREKFAGFDCVEIVEQESLSAVKLFQDYYFDFIYIDANPSYETTMQNFNVWINKARPGGIIGGHNAKWTETIQAVRDKVAGLPEEKMVFVDGNDWWIVKSS